LDACPLASDPKACFAYFQRALTKLGHPFDYLKCLHCKAARTNAIIAHPPEEDPGIDFGDMARYKIDPRDFLDTAEVKLPEKRGRKPRLACSKGHLYSKYGAKRKDHGHRCRLCESVKKKRARELRKAA
jgi:hypothetical protein